MIDIIFIRCIVEIIDIRKNNQLSTFTFTV